MKRIFWLSTLLLSASFCANAQGTLSIDKVYSAYLRNSGTIMESNQIKGYFFLYQSDKIDRHTNEYTLQILDQNLNKVQDIKFQDSKKLNLLEAAYNGNSLAFLFKNDDTKTLEMRLYDMSGKAKYSYTRDYDKKTEDLMKQYEASHTDEGTNQNVYDMGEKGYVSVMPLRDGKNRTYEVDYYGSKAKGQWAYVPAEDESQKYASADFLGNTDSLIILEVMTKKHATSTDMVSHVVGINFVTKRKDFDLTYDADKFKFVPGNVMSAPDGKIMLMGSYYDQNANVAKDFSNGIAVYMMDTKGKMLSQAYNSWTQEFAKFLPLNNKGKVDNIGYLYIHKMIRTPDGKVFAIGEGYKRQASAGGIALTALNALGGGYSSAIATTKMVVTDMVVMEFNDKFKVTNTKIYDKTNNDVSLMGMPGADYLSQHTLAMMLKARGSFDYEFTTGESDNSTFSVCYSEYEHNKDYRGESFNSLHYNGSKFTTDRIELKSKASSMRVFPAKPGSVMIMEYFKKDKKLNFRLEKLG